MKSTSSITGTFWPLECLFLVRPAKALLPIVLFFQTGSAQVPAPAAPPPSVTVTNITFQTHLVTITNDVFMTNLVVITNVATITNIVTSTNVITNVSPEPLPQWLPWMNLGTLALAAFIVLILWRRGGKVQASLQFAWREQRSALRAAAVALVLGLLLILVVPQAAKTFWDYFQIIALYFVRKPVGCAPRCDIINLMRMKKNRSESLWGASGVGMTDVQI